MKLEVVKHHSNRLNGWSIAEKDKNIYLSELANGNIYYSLYNEWLIDFPEIIKEKFNAFHTHPFCFKNKEDAERFLEYLEPFIIMEELMK